MIGKMANKVAVGSEWFLVSMTWIEKWQKHVNFDGEEDSNQERPHPGKIDNSDIMVPYAPKQRVAQDQ